MQGKPWSSWPHRSVGTVTAIINVCTSSSILVVQMLAARNWRSRC